MDSLIQRSGLTAARLSAMLLVMELDGKLMAMHGRYCRKP
jgi:DNA processing protein